MRLASCATSAVSHSWTNSSGPRRTRSTAAIAMTPSLPPAVMAAEKSSEPVSVKNCLIFNYSCCAVPSQRRFGMHNRCSTYPAAGSFVARLRANTTKCMTQIVGVWISSVPGIGG
jgi:hypothetical protein